jgi:predicted Zn-dependent peptidase
LAQSKFTSIFIAGIFTNSRKDDNGFTMKNSFQFLTHLTTEPREKEVVGLQLPNGLQIILYKNQQTPIVAVDLWYKVGSKNELPGKSGFAHLFEHLMFEGSENVEKAQHMKLINDVGGMVNGSTTQDRTNYWEILPSNQLELALWLEADRMQSLKVTKDNFENQRATVKEERRMRIDNQPYMRILYELKDEIAYQNFAYKHSVIGSMEDLDRATLKDVREFHDLYYRPNNAVLAIAGDFEMLAAQELLHKNFGDIPAGEKIPEVNLSEPSLEKELRHVYNDPFAPFPALSLSYKTPERTHPDFPVFEILEKVLCDGESSRFYATLIEQQQLALHVLAGKDGKFGPGLFFVFAQLHPQQQLKSLEKSIQNIFEDISKNGITEAELNKARNKMKAEYISHQETVRSMADLFCMFTTLYEDPNKFFEEFEAYDHITNEQIQAVAGKYFVPGNRSVIEVYPALKQ